jgi:hypothetical protein
LILLDIDLRCKNIRKRLDKIFSSYNYLVYLTLMSINILVIVSPVYSIFWLSLHSVHLFYRNQFRFILWSWLGTLLVWYLIFSVVFFEFGPAVVLRGENSRILIEYLLFHQKACGFQKICATKRFFSWMR